MAFKNRSVGRKRFGPRGGVVDPRHSQVDGRRQGSEHEWGLLDGKLTERPSHDQHRNAPLSGPGELLFRRCQIAVEDRLAVASPEHQQVGVGLVDPRRQA
jgi:hypothetical protein